MYLYDSYCYESLDDIADSIRSKAVLDDGSFISSVVIKDQTLDITLTRMLSDRNVSFTYTMIPPSCDRLGFNNSFTGLTSADSVSASMLFFSGIAFVWALMILRRGI